MALEDALKPLQDVDGYMAAAFFDINGDVLAQHNVSKHKIELIGANSISVVRTAMKAMKSAEMGTPHFIQINADAGILLTTWAVVEKSLSVLLLEPDGNVGLAKIQLAKAGESGGSLLA